MMGVVSATGSRPQRLLNLIIASCLEACHPVTFSTYKWLPNIYVQQMITKKGMHMILLKSFWRVFTETKSEKSARTVLGRFERTISQEIVLYKISNYYKGGHEITFELQHENNVRSEIIIEVISLGERVGRGWHLTGSIQNQPSGWTNSSTISGVTAINWDIIE